MMSDIGESAGPGTDDRPTGFASSDPDPRRVVVVTGGTGGLGRWVVRRFAANGNRVHVPARSGPGGLDPSRALPDDREDAGGADRPVAGSETSDPRERITLHDCDVTEPGAVESFFGDVVAVEGRVDVLVNGVGGFAMAPVLETDPEIWRKMMELNATSVFLCSRSAGISMREAGWGRIVNVASMPALERGSPGMAAYGAAKTALVHFTRSLSEELLEDGVTVNAVVPTVIDTPANRDAMPDASRESWLQPRQIADVVAFLASDAAEIVTGAAIPLSRG